MKTRLGHSICILLLIFVCSSSFAQDYFSNYKPLQSSGPIPKDFLQLSSKKYEEEKASLSKDDKGFEKKAKKAFFLESSFLLQELLYSGKVLFNDPIGLYVNQVADQLLETNPALRQQIRFYVVKSPSVNAFATNSGMIFINLGLISQVETESQLAFILSHEITHYLKKHVVTQYVEERKIEKGINTYRSLSSEDKLLTRNNYSKELETEADLEGLSIFLQSKYSTKELNGVFDMLQYAHLPFDDIPFQKSFFESEYLQFPSTYFLEKIKVISAPSEKDEEKSSHPSVEKRRAYILNHTKNDVSTGKADYLVSKQAFLEARKLARYELSSLYLIGLRYEKAIYNSYLLLREDPNNGYLQKSIAKALYGLSQYANADAYSKVHGEEDEVEGNSRQVYHLFENLKAKELNALALKYSWDLKKKYPDDLELPSLCDTLLKSLVYKHCDTDSDFSVQPPAAESLKISELASADTTDYEKRSKYQKIAIDKLRNKTVDQPYFINYIFVDNFKDQTFAQAYEKHLREKKKSNEKRSETKKQERARLKRESNQQAKQEKTIRKKGAALGIDKIVMISPSHTLLDQRKKNSIKYVASENAELSLMTQIQKNAQLAKLDVVLLSENSFQSSDVKQFNDYAFLRNWIREHVRHQEASVSMQNLDAATVQSLVAKYGTQYYCWSGFVSVREKKRYVGATLFYTAIIYPLLPLGIYYAVTPNYDTYYYSLVFDITTGKPVFTDFQYIDQKTNRDVLNSTVYNSFYQLKKKR
jgi:hypothetical protein